MRPIGTEGIVPEFDLTDRMRKALRHSGLTAGDMAEYLDVARETVARWLNGTRSPSTQTLRLWASRTGVDYEWLTTGESASTPPSA
ncbi:transcriptional regulator with XRE-family HTH domain [Prescottella agglutinans]|uniref:Transcriptional regulator with XRE-family HTH domain n=2 Tax=Prescottella agglutinans TaxID=1644129 RepID=A0ABT6MEN6_9NOCA|nr:transcriptional regulator with XRE-family HTH domain [Prescottella agglutinans]